MLQHCGASSDSNLALLQLVLAFSVHNCPLLQSHSHCAQLQLWPHLCLCAALQLPSQTEGGQKQWANQGSLAQFGQSEESSSYNWNVPVVVEIFRLLLQPEGGHAFSLGSWPWVPWHCQAAQSSGMVWAVTCTCSQLSGISGGCCGHIWGQRQKPQLALPLELMMLVLCHP